MRIQLEYVYGDECISFENYNQRGIENTKTNEFLRIKFTHMNLNAKNKQEFSMSDLENNAVKTEMHNFSNTHIQWA